MDTILKSGTPFLYDAQSGDVVGIRDQDGGDTFFTRAPQFTWANKPLASSRNAGLVIRITDVGVAPGILVVSDGTRWVPASAQLLARSAVAAALTGSTNETALATVTVPAGLMGVDGALHVYTTWATTNSANNKTLRVRFGGAAGNAYMANVLTTSASFNDMRRIRNRNSAASQVGTGSASASAYAAAGGAVTTSAVDTASAVDLVLSGQLATAAESISLENYEVWITP